jgi:hypothetical protein
MNRFGNSSFESLFLISLGVTVFVETAVILCLIRLVFKITSSRLSWTRCFFAASFTSFATLPYLWFVLPAFIHPYPLLIASGELSVFIIEAAAYVFLLNLSFRRSLILSFFANLASIIVGLFVVPP